MIGTGRNVGDVRRFNISLILKLLYYEGPQSRKVLARKASLTPAAVTMLTTELMEKGYIVDSELTMKKNGAGRAEQYIDLNYQGLYMLGLQIGRQAAQIRIYNLGLECVGSTSVEISSFSSVDSLFEYLCDKIAFLMVKSDITIKNLLGVGVTINGIVDPVNGISVNSFGLIPENVNIRQQIESRLHLPVIVNNNVRSMLMAESAINHHNQGVSHFFIKYGPGVGGAFSIDQQTYNGAGYRAMEIGHVIIEPEGELCRCGRRGCLETVLSYRTLFRQVQERMDETTTPVLFQRLKQGDVTLETIAASLAGGDLPIQKLIEEKFTLFSRCLEGYVTVLDPRTISVCSEIFQYDPFREIFLKCVRKDAPSVESRLVLNPDNEKTEQIGAVALVVNSFLNGQI